MTTDAEIVVAVRGETNGARAVKRQLDDLANSGDKTTSAMQRAERQMQSLDKAAKILKTAMVGLVGSFGIAQLLSVADKYQVLQARIQGVTRATGDYVRVSKELFDISQRTGSVLEDNVQLFQRINIGAKELGKTNNEVMRLTETINQLGLLGGSSVVALRAGTMQFSQAMAGGILRAEEFNSIMENIPEVGAAIAKGMNLTVGSLRQAVLAGTVLAKDVFDSLAGQSAEIAARFSAMPLSLERAVQMLKNSLQQYVGDFDSSIGLTRSLAESVALLANNVDDFAKAITLLAAAGLSALIGKLALSTSAWIAETIATRAAAVAAFDVAKAQQTASLMTLNAVRSNTALTASHISTAAAARAYTASTLQLGSAQAALAATSLTLRGVGAATLAIMGGWPGVILAAAAALIIFRKDIMNALDGLEIFGTSAGNILRDIGFGAKTIFAGVATAIGGLFVGLMNGFDGWLASLNVKLYKFTESMNKLPGVNIDNSALLSGISAPGYFEKSQRTFGENFALGFDQVQSGIEGWIADGMTPKAGKGTSPIVQEATALNQSLDTSKETAKALKAAQGDLDSLVKSTYTEQEKYNARIKELEYLRGFAKTAEEITAIERGIKAAGDELEKVRIQAERNGPVAKAFESLASEIDDGFKDAFKGAFTETDGGFKKLIAGWKSTFKDFLAELAYQALARPIVLSVVGGVGGVMGVSSGARASILGTSGGISSGGGFGLGDIGSLLSSGWSAISNGLSTPIFGAGSMLGSGINSIGASLGLNNASFIGPMMPGASNLASAFTPMAGLAGFGGNMLGNLIFGGNRGIGSSIGGALGGIGGTAVGASMGTILGMAGGPAGALIGAFLGNALGGLFGGGQKRETIGASFGVEDGLLNVGYVGTKGVDGGKANEFANGLVETLNLVAQTIGAQYISGFSMETNVGSKDRGTNFGNTRVSGNPTDVTAIVRAMLNSDEHITGGGDLLGVARRSLDMNNDIEEMLSDVTFAKSILEAAKTPAELVAEAMAAVNKEFDAMYERAERLALPMDKVAETLEKNREAALGMIKAQQAGFQSMEAMKATFDSWLYDQSLSGTSTLSPLEKLIAAQGNFGGLLTQVQGGDYTATQQLLQAGQQLLTLGQSMYASSVEFGLLEKFVRDSIGSVAHQIGVPGYASGTMSARSGLAWVGERGPELVNFNGGERVHNAEESKMMARQMARQESDIASMKENMAAVAETNRRMERQINRLTNNLISKAASGV